MGWFLRLFLEGHSRERVADREYRAVAGQSSHNPTS